MYDMTPEAAPEPSSLSAAQAGRLDAVTREADRLNAAIREAVEAGLSVELLRAARHHCGMGCWGDQMRPVVVLCR